MGGPAATSSSPDSVTTEPSTRTPAVSNPASSHAASVPARRPSSRPGRKSTSEANSAGVGRLRVLPPSAGQGQFRGVANFGHFGGHPSDFGGRAFDPEGRGAELGIESGVEPGRGPPGFGDPGASDLAQLRSSRVRLGRDRQPADRAARLRRWHGLGVGGELTGRGQDGTTMPLPGRLGGYAGLGGERPFLPGQLVGLVGSCECRGGSTVRGLGAVQHRRDVGDLLTASPHSIGRGADVDAGQCVAIGTFHSVAERPRSQHRRIEQREGDSRGARVPGSRPQTVPDAGQIAIEPPAVRRDPVDRLPRTLLSGHPLSGEQAGLGLEAGDVVAAGEQRLQVPVSRGGDQAGRRRRGLAVLAAQPRDLPVESSIFDVGCLGGGAQSAAALRCRACGTHPSAVSSAALRRTRRA